MVWCEDAWRRPALTKVTVAYYRWGLIPVEYQQYRLVDMCPMCGEQADEVIRRRRRWVGAAIVGIGMFLWVGRSYSFALGLVGGVVAALVIVFGRHLQRHTLIPQDGRRDE